MSDHSGDTGSFNNSSTFQRERLLNDYDQENMDGSSIDLVPSNSENELDTDHSYDLRRSQELIPQEVSTNNNLQFSSNGVETDNISKIETGINTTVPFKIHPRPKNLQPKPSYQLQLEIYYGGGMPNKTIIINVYNENNPKPFLGGFRNTLTNLMYHHAATQTDSQKQKDPTIKSFHRETQTKKFTTKGQQTLREQGTQMEKPGLTIDTSEDRIIYPSSNYFDSEMLKSLKIEMAIKIQRNVRRWIAKRKVDRMREQKYKEIEMKEQAKKQKEMSENHKKYKEIKRRMHPRKPQDFQIMYDELEAWRTKETEDINSNALPGSKERKEAMKELLRKETKLLQTIDRLKIVAGQQNMGQKIQRDLEEMAKPKRISRMNTTRVNYNRARALKEGAIPHSTSTDESNINYTEIETPYTIRARELRDLYYGLNTEMLSIDERLDVLMHVKWTVKEFEKDSLSKDIIELIDREADLLNRGRKDSSLVGLRKRLSNLFLHFIHEPKYNPEAMVLVNRKKNQLKKMIEQVEDEDISHEYTIEFTSRDLENHDDEYYHSLNVDQQDKNDEQPMIEVVEEEMVD
ncbi:hypothetical protein FDP41_001679 [Naegleria fowleri]|uniref:IQ motif and ubiquitin-like domain-containing protein n=1 Tax=Naegleria fowleri TaxID=5763 RepID=A0A6A5BVM9_NAEFO|nr:uncharacterized protein FDP41_001679 [Naegleria fowleri]KAF0979336.1 hypothetical protein FDP41_001679 [Naegleria fowleri]CAG4712557.1 unnamed protein product [Naegleria fowleri]